MRNNSPDANENLRKMSLISSNMKQPNSFLTELEEYRIKNITPKKKLGITTNLINTINNIPKPVKLDNKETKIWDSKEIKDTEIPISTKCIDDTNEKYYKNSSTKFNSKIKLKSNINWINDIKTQLKSCKSLT